MTAAPRLSAGARAGIAICAALAAVAHAPARAAQPEPSIAESLRLGRALVLRNCGMCHAVGQTDASVNPQAPPFRNLNQRMDVEELGEGLATGILTQHPAMPEFRFEPREVVAIVRYLRSIQGRSHAGAQTGLAPAD